MHHRFSSCVIGLCWFLVCIFYFKSMYYDIPMPFPMRYLMPWLIHDFLAKINFFMFYVPFTFFYFFYNFRCNRRGRLIFNTLMKYVAPEKKVMNALGIVFFYYVSNVFLIEIMGSWKQSFQPKKLRKFLLLKNYQWVEGNSEWIFLFSIPRIFWRFS